MKFVLLTLLLISSSCAMADGMEHEGDAWLTTYPRQVVITVRGDKAVALQYALDFKKTGADKKTVAHVQCAKDGSSCDVYWGE